jgi:hypothetical protein
MRLKNAIRREITVKRAKNMYTVGFLTPAR